MRVNFSIFHTISDNLFFIISARTSVVAAGSISSTLMPWLLSGSMIVSQRPNASWWFQFSLTYSSADLLCISVMGVELSAMTVHRWPWRFLHFGSWGILWARWKYTSNWLSQYTWGGDVLWCISQSMYVQISHPTSETSRECIFISWPISFILLSKSTYKSLIIVCIETSSSTNVCASLSFSKKPTRGCSLGIKALWSDMASTALSHSFNFQKLHTVQSGRSVHCILAVTDMVVPVMVFPCTIQ